MLLAAITPIDRRESLLRQAHALRINSTSATGESVEDLLYELSSAAVGGHRQAVLAKVEAANFGKKGKTLADKVAARLAKHAFGGKYSDMGLEGNDAAIGAFHTHLEQAKREGAAAVTMTPADREMIELGQRVKMMFEGSEGIASDGMLEQISQLQRMNSHLMAELMRLRDIAKQTELSSTATAKPRPSGSGSDCDDEDKMGLFD